MSFPPPTGPAHKEPPPLPAGTQPQWSAAGDYYWDGTRWVLYFPEAARQTALSPAPASSTIAPSAPAQYPAPMQAPYAQPPSGYGVAKTQITVSAGTAFKIGFFGLMGAWVAALIPTIILWIFLGAVFATCAAALSRGGAGPTP